MTTPSTQLAAAVELMLTPPPLVDTALAAEAAAQHYGWRGICTALSGERDRNFLLVPEGREPVTLKFINASESVQETDLQVRALEFLASGPFVINAPRPLQTLRGEDGFVLQAAHGPIRGRAYTYLEGTPAVLVEGSAALRHAVGAAVGQLSLALRGFRHALMSRVFLWDLMHVGQLAAFTHHVDDAEARAFVTEFLGAFTGFIEPGMAALPSQLIHADLSKSNLLVSPLDNDRVSGVLDFGDMVYAPRIADLAIAASYQMSDSDHPMAALEQVQAGFLSACELSPVERMYLLDLVVARLVQRLVLTAWRASHFPENRTYILRSQPDALRLIHLLIPVWRDDFRRRYPQAFR